MQKPQSNPESFASYAKLSGKKIVNKKYVSVMSGFAGMTASYIFKIQGDIHEKM